MSVEILVVTILILELVTVCSVWYIIHKQFPKHRMSFRESLDLTSLPVITFYNNGHRLNFILDTGSSTSLINQKDLDNCEFKDCASQYNILGVGANTDEKHGEVIMILERNGRVFNSNFVVSDLSDSFDKIKQHYGIPIHGLLGNNFLKKYRYVIDFNEQTAYIK